MTLKGVAGVILFIQLRRQSTLQCKFYESSLNQRSNVQQRKNAQENTTLTLKGKLTNTNRTFVAARGAGSASLMLVTRKKAANFRRSREARSNSIQLKSSQPAIHN